MIQIKFYEGSEKFLLLRGFKANFMEYKLIDLWSTKAGNL